MNNENEKRRGHDLGQRIVSLIRANEPALKKPITDEEVQKLKAAAARLDHMLKAAFDADGQVLRSASTRSVIGRHRYWERCSPMTSSGGETGKKERRARNFQGQ